VSTCPNGHQSAADDFCDTCGAPIAPPAVAPPPPAPSAPEAPTPLKKSCPNCGGQNAADALFCEACGYDFTTGQRPPATAAPSSPDTAQASAPASAAAALAAADWVAEIWIDPDFFAAQQAAGVCPTGGAPTVVPLTGREEIIGRHSSSSGNAVDIDCSGDSATSHRHAKLTLDHDRWYLEDLGSTNGTFVGTPTLMPPTALTTGERHELGDSERIYIGAWTRIVIRRATAEERGAASLSI
jgi:FHA domain/Double zinc ribbon